MKYMGVGKIGDLAPGGHKKVGIEGKDILLVNIGGKFHALADKCPHMGGSLSEGLFENGQVVCPRHHARFDLETGKNIGEAKLLFLKLMVKDATVFEVKNEGGELMVGID